ncbi:DsbA family protein [Saccharibacillus alkalitolerans]|uniref:DsbA family protein n=1 Tax=Saccharibacillus alkalitolerans TaxID=2705290 RepID=A0ABX0F8P8_9BACL|nr:DsbA family protein [Saccharibacillus alkalitolerans]NGZ75581.1 DsbA family protein [Saccharibacillus alkalitolerans]
MSKNKKPAPKNNGKPQAQGAKRNTGGAQKPQNGKPQNQNTAASQWTSGSKRKKSNFSAIALGFVGVVVLLMVLIYVLTKVGENQTSTSSAEPVVLTGYEASNQPTLGDPASDVKIVEFGDFKCPDCKVWTETVLPELQAKYLDTNEASFQFADYPFLADDSTLLALGGQTLYEQNPDYFWPYYKAVYANQDASKVRESWITEDYIVDLVKKTVPDADIEKFASDLKNKTHQANVDADVKAGDDSKITGTPTIFVNGTKVDNPTLENVEAAIEAAKAS